MYEAPFFCCGSKFQTVRKALVDFSTTSLNNLCTFEFQNLKMESDCCIIITSMRSPVLYRQVKPVFSPLIHSIFSSGCQNTAVFYEKLNNKSLI